MPHRSRPANFVFDCRVDDLGPAAEFWSQALRTNTATVNTSR